MHQAEEAGWGGLGREVLSRRALGKLLDLKKPDSNYQNFQTVSI